MTPTTTSFYENYTPAADVLVIAVCIIFVILIRAAYINRTRSFRYLRHMIYLAVVASVSNIVFHESMNLIAYLPHGIAYASRILFHLSLYSILWLLFLYIKETVQVSLEKSKLYFILTVSGFITLFILEVTESLFKFGFYIEEDHTVHAARLRVLHYVAPYSSP